MTGAQCKKNKTGIHQPLAQDSELHRGVQITQCFYRQITKKQKRRVFLTMGEKKQKKPEALHS